MLWDISHLILEMLRCLEVVSHPTTPNVLQDAYGDPELLCFCSYLWSIKVLLHHTQLLILFLRQFLCLFLTCPGTHFAGQAGLELTDIRLLLPPECWTKGVRHHTPTIHLHTFLF